MKSKKFKSFLGIISVAIGSGMIYVSANDIFSVGADSLSSSTNTSSLTIIFFVCGILLVATGIMSALFIFAASGGNKR